MISRLFAPDNFMFVLSGFVYRSKIAIKTFLSKEEEKEEGSLVFIVQSNCNEWK